MSTIRKRLETLIIQAGTNATQEQSNAVVTFITSNFPKDQWRGAADKAMDVGSVYTDISERLGESGIY